MYGNCNLNSTFTLSHEKDGRTLIYHVFFFFTQDEECLRPGEVSDMTFLSKLISTIGKHEHFVW